MACEELKRELAAAKARIAELEAQVKAHEENDMKVAALIKKINNTLDGMEATLEG